MIEFTKSYKTEDGAVFATIAEAQSHELTKIMDDDAFDATTHVGIANFILAKKDLFVDILTTTPNSKPKARKVNGGTKKRGKILVATADAGNVDLTTGA